MIEVSARVFTLAILGFVVWQAGAYLYRLTREEAPLPYWEVGSPCLCGNTAAPGRSVCDEPDCVVSGN